jgi:O-antigen/teichoic acid export membrane protein
MQAASKVVLNTSILYLRMLLTVGITLYTTRLVLDALGATDYGIYNLIAGIVAMLSFLNTAMATSTQRYLSYHQGTGDVPMQVKIFTNSLAIHVGIGVIVVAGLEIAGFLLLDDFLKIPDSRIDAAKTVYHYMSATVFFTIVSVPFVGSLTAHENMLWVAFVNIVETLCKLGVALLLFTANSDKLVFYGYLTASISIVSLLMYAVFCVKKYPECRISQFTMPEKTIVRELTSFAGWNLFGSLCSVGRSQGLAILLNLFFGALVNTAYGIANQISAQLTFLSATMLRALNPQIMKSEGANDRERMLRLSMTASKFGFFLLAIISIPAIFEMEELLQLWLKNTPRYTVVFCKLILVAALVNQLTIGLQSALQAIGKITQYQFIVGSLILMNLPIAWLLLRSGFPAYYALCSYIVVEFMACVLRLYFANTIGGLSIRAFMERVVLKELLPTTLAILACFLVVITVHNSYRFLFTFSVSCLSYIIGIYFAGLCEDEKNMIQSIIKKLFSKLRMVRGIEPKFR